MSNTPSVLLIVITLYFLMLFAVSKWTSRDADDQTFFDGNKSSPWYLVAFGMIGASLSGVTFVSIPGVVGLGRLNQSFAYMQVVFGYLVGYFIIATVLMPLYYRLNLTSIYEYVLDRFGYVSYRTSAFFFLLSRLMGSSLRLFLVAIILQEFVFEAFGVPFWVVVMMTIFLIWIYTNKGGIKTIVWTDSIQTASMLIGLIVSLYFILNGLNLGWSDLIPTIRSSDYGRLFYFDNGWSDPNNFFKQFISGAFIAVVMTGLDQDMMQKNLTCKNINDAQKNMFSFSIILVIVNALFLALGAMLYIYSAAKGISIPDKSDHVFANIAINHMPTTVGILFIIGLIAAAYSSADSALTSLTTSFCIDFLDFKRGNLSIEKKRIIRKRVHIGFSMIIFFIIIIFKFLNNSAIINAVFIFAGYTYGPILGLFVFGMWTKRRVLDNYVIWICLLAPCLSYVINYNSEFLFGGFNFGFLIIFLNGMLTFLGLWAISKSRLDRNVNKIST